MEDERVLRALEDAIRRAGSPIGRETWVKACKDSGLSKHTADSARTRLSRAGLVNYETVREEGKPGAGRRVFDLTHTGRTRDRRRFGGIS